MTGGDLRDVRGVSGLRRRAGLAARGTARGLLMRGLWACAAVAVLVGCDGLGKTPFALQLNAVDESRPQQPAAITISDPQIYSRSTLENDRRRQAELIKALLSGSYKAVTKDNGFDYSFEPTIVRDLVNSAALVAEVRAAFNPTAGAQAERAEAEAAAASDQRVDAIRSGDVTVNANSDPQGADGGESEIPEDRLAEIQQKLDLLVERNDTLLTSLAERAGERGAKKTGVKATPLEQFRDLQAFRAELRQALSEVELDDLHDYAGNALYRLQFMATVMPGSHKDKFGVARLTYLPPLLDDGDILNLYRDWLVHLSRRMNPVLPEPRFEHENATPTRLQSAGLVRVVKFQGCGRDTLIAVPYLRTDNAKTLRNTFDTTSYTIASETAPYTIASETAPKTVRQHLASEFHLHDGVFDPWVLRHLQSILPWLAGEYGAGSCDRARIASITEKLGRVLRGMRSAVESDTRLLDAFDEPLSAPTAFSDLIAAETDAVRKTVDDAGKVEDERMKGAIAMETIPSVTKFVNYGAPSSKVVPKGIKIAKGRAYAYATIPIERSQGLSTIARSANSLQLALSLAATVPTAGSSGGLDIGYTRSAAGNVEALERAPLVIGFADRRAPLERLTRASADPLYAADVQVPQSGWVFGPAARVNADDNTLELMHTVASHRVAADVSLPGWWPRARIVLETAWIGNWHDTGRPLRLEDEAGEGYYREHFDVVLPRNAADFDGLTNLLMSLTVGHVAQRAEVTHIEPFNVSACARTVDFVIRGANIWRSTEVRLAGYPAEQVRVLPDMDGVSATVDLNAVFAATNETASAIGLRREVPLSVVTRNGMDVQTINVVGSRVPGTVAEDGGETGARCVGASQIATTRSDRTIALGDVAPDRVTVGAENSAFVVTVSCTTSKDKEGDDRCGNPTFLLGGQQGTWTRLSTGTTAWTQVYRVAFPDAVAVGKDVEAIPLTAVVGSRVATVPIAVDDPRN
jgi:hypothetical protein